MLQSLRVLFFNLIAARALFLVVWNGFDFQVIVICTRDAHFFTCCITASLAALAQSAMTKHMPKSYSVASFIFVRAAAEVVGAS